MNASNASFELFVSPHAVSQFQLRIAPLEESVARKVIEDGICQATNVRVLPDGETLRVRTRRPFPYEFRAYCVFDHKRGHRVVTTVVRGDSSITRKRKRKVSVGLNSTAASAAIEFSPVFQRRDQSGTKDHRRVATTVRHIQPSATRRRLNAVYRDPALKKTGLKSAAAMRRRSLGSENASGRANDAN